MGSLGQALLDNVIFKKDLSKIESQNRNDSHASKTWPAVDDERMAGDERSFVGNKEKHAVGDFFRGAHAQQRFIAARHPGALFFRGVFIDGPSRGKPAKARCLNGAGADAVHPYAILP